MDYAALMTKAALLRKEFGEDSNSPIDVFAMAQNIDGLTLVYYPMGDNLSGMCVKGQNDNNLIAINSSMTLGRQRFSLAHEFYHLFFDDNMITVCAKKIGEGKDIEKEADMFASYFLMPDTSLILFAEKCAKENDNQISLIDVIRLEQYFGVSHQSAVYRLMHTPYLSKKQAENYLSMPVRHTAEILGFSSDLYRPSPECKKYMTYGKYIKQAEELLHKNKISIGKYEELLLEAFRTDLVYGDDELEGGDVID